MQAALRREATAKRELRQVEAEMTAEMTAGELAAAKAADMDWCAANAQDSVYMYKHLREKKKRDYNDVREHTNRPPSHCD